MKVKIHCFEGEWDRKHPELSVKPLLHVIEQLNTAAGNSLTFSYRLCQSIERLRNHLRSFDRRKMSRDRNAKNCFYFAFHGNSYGLSTFDSEDEVSFKEIGNLLGDKLTDSIVLFGSCGTRASDKKLQQFQQETAAELVVGYSANVDWLSSSLFEMLFFSELCRFSKTGNFKNKLEKMAADNKSLFSTLKVQFAYK